MKITKFGQCCLLIEEKGKRILTDPGIFSSSQNELQDLDAIFITHEHRDHLHMDSLKEVLFKNPSAKVVTNSSVGKILDQENIKYEVVDGGKETNVGDILIEGFNCEHGYIYDVMPTVENTGYLFDKRFYYGGDSLVNPNRKIEILAIPLSGPWVKFSDVADWVKEIKPKIVFPVHDAILTKAGIDLVYMLCNRVFSVLNIDFKELGEGDSFEV